MECMKNSPFEGKDTAKFHEDHVEAAVGNPHIFNLSIILVILDSESSSQ
jgi:hypothetical protein